MVQLRPYCIAEISRDRDGAAKRRHGSSATYLMHQDPYLATKDKGPLERAALRENWTACAQPYGPAITGGSSANPGGFSRGSRDDIQLETQPCHPTRHRITSSRLLHDDENWHESACGGNRASSVRLYFFDMVLPLPLSVGLSAVPGIALRSSGIPQPVACQLSTRAGPAFSRRSGP